MQMRTDGPDLNIRILLSLAFAAAGYISRRCFRSPNPLPSNPYRNDRLIHFLYCFNGAQMREWACMLMTILHIVVLLWAPPPWNADINLTYFRPTAYTLSWLLIIYFAGAVRLAAFSTLGSSFTFELAPPKKLVTTGMYAYVQHPSYPPDMILTVANLALFFNADGVLGYMLPGWIVGLNRSHRTMHLCLAALFHSTVMAIRVTDEERMLREEFGQQWEDWHRQTRRFIPGVI